MLDHTSTYIGFAEREEGESLGEKEILVLFPPFLFPFLREEGGGGEGFQSNVKFFPLLSSLASSPLSLLWRHRPSHSLVLAWLARSLLSWQR